MREAEFKELVKQRFCKCQDLMLYVKGPEYTTYSNPDRLANFKRAGDIQECMPEAALVGMWMKHIVSILDIVDEWEKENIMPSKEMLQEKITDAINYLVLLEALFVDSGLEEPMWLDRLEMTRHTAA